MKHESDDRPTVEHPTVDELFQFFAGEMEEGESESTLRHLSQCSDCRGSFESRHGEFRDRMIESAAVRGYLPPDRSRLRKRVFRAVSRDHATRPSVPRRTTLPLHPRVALVAAAALILVAVGVRFLGDTRWNGRLLSQGGAQLLVMGDDERFSFVTAEEYEVGEGDLVLVLPGPPAAIDLPHGGRIDLPAPALIALDNAEGRPRILIARGYVEIDTRDGPPIAVNAAEREFTVSGTAEFHVEMSSRNAAFEWATGALGRSVGAAFFPEVYAAAPLQARVTAHSLDGTIRGRSGLLIRSGQASTFRPGSSGSPPVRIGGVATIRPDEGFLTAEETAATRKLLVRTGGDRNALAAVLDEALGTPPYPPCLAAWLLGEMGHSDGVAPLQRVISDRRPRDAALRSAATASLVRLADENTTPSPWDLVLDDEPAVAEAAMLAATEVSLGNPVRRLQSVFEDEDRPADLRVLAAALLRKESKPVPNALLFGFLTEDDPSVAALAARTLARHDGGPALLARYLPQAGDDLAAVILPALSGQNFRDAAAEARILLDRATGKPDPASRALFAAALSHLGLLQAGGLDDAVGRALREGDFAAKRAALTALLRTRSPGKHLARVEAILRSPAEPTRLRLQALLLLHPEREVPEDLLGTGDDEFDGRIRSRLLAADQAGTRGDLARRSLDHPSGEARQAAWEWLGRHAPVEAVDRAVRWQSTKPADGAHLVVAGLRWVPDALHQSSLPAAEIEGHRDRAAAVLGSILWRRGEDPDVENQVLSDLVEFGRPRTPRGERRAIHGSPTALKIIRELAEDAERAVDLRLRAATLIAWLGTSDADRATVERLMTGSDEPLAAATARSFMTPVAPPPEAFVRRLRAAVTYPRARARIALCPPFDPEYATSILQAGDATASALVLRYLHSDEAARLGSVVVRHLEDDRALNRLLAVRLLDRVPDRLLGDPDPWVRLVAIAVRVRGGVLPDGIDVEAAVAGVQGRVRRALTKALSEFAAAPGPKTAEVLLEQIPEAPPIHDFVSAQGNFEPPPRGHVDRQEIRARRQSRHLRHDALERLSPGMAGAGQLQAVDRLATHGHRADLAVLFRLAGDETNDEELRRAAVHAASDLLSRHLDVAEPGPALSELRAWWRERSFALAVPVLPR